MNNSFRRSSTKTFVLSRFFLLFSLFALFFAYTALGNVYTSSSTQGDIDVGFRDSSSVEHGLETFLEAELDSRGHTDENDDLGNEAISRDLQIIQTNDAFEIRNYFVTFDATDVTRNRQRIEVGYDILAFQIISSFTLRIFDDRFGDLDETSVRLFVDGEAVIFSLFPLNGGNFHSIEVETIVLPGAVSSLRIQFTIDDGICACKCQMSFL